MTVVLFPRCMGMNAAGDIYTADGTRPTASERRCPGLDGIANSSADDVISTVTGGTTTGYCGDGAAACLPLPRATTLDAAGNLNIADEGNCRIRETRRWVRLRPLSGAWWRRPT